MLGEDRSVRNISLPLCRSGTTPAKENLTPLSISMMNTKESCQGIKGYHVSHYFLLKPLQCSETVMCVIWVYFRKQVHGTDFRHVILHGTRIPELTYSHGSSAQRCPCSIVPPACHDRGDYQSHLLAVLPENSYTTSFPTTCMVITSFQVSGPRSVLLCGYTGHLIASSALDQEDQRLGLRSLIHQVNSLMSRLFTT